MRARAVGRTGRCWPRCLVTSGTAVYYPDMRDIPPPRASGGTGSGSGAALVGAVGPADGADRESARLFATLLLALIVLGGLSGIVQLLLVRDFAPTFARIATALVVLCGAYALSRTRFHRAAVVFTALAVIAACASVPFASPHDPAWYAFMLMAVGFAAAFLPTRAAVGVALLALSVTAGVVWWVPELSDPSRRVAPLMVHIVISPLLLLFFGLRRRAEAARRMQALQRERATRESNRLQTLGRLAAGVAHDFNNLLTIVQCNTMSLRAGRDCDHALLSEIELASERAAALSRQLLGFVRKEPERSCALSMNALLLELEPILRRLVGSRIQLELVLCDDSPELTADPVQLEQIILNLIINARDAIRAKGTIRVQTGAAPRTPKRDARPAVLLRVMDDGIGMDDATIARIFEPFFSTKSDEGGTGLGLATVHDLVTQLGGTIAVETQVQRGTTFEVCLPARRSIGTPPCGSPDTASAT